MESDVSRPLVSVLMVVYRPDPVYFPLAVRSILQQTFRDLEFIIVEDPSDQPAAPLLAQFSDDRLRHVCNPQRTTYLGQRNQSLALARAEYGAVIDADDIAHPERIGEQYRLAKSDPNISLLGTQLEVIDPQGQRLGWRRYPTEHAEIIRAFHQHNPFAHPSIFFRPEVLIGLGGYRYDRYPACEDYDLWSRVAKAGHKVANHPHALLQYRSHPGSMKGSKIRGVLRGSREVKQMHWSEDCTLRDRLRSLAERSLLLLPPRLVLRLFERSQLDRQPPPGSPPFPS